MRFSSFIIIGIMLSFTVSNASSPGTWHTDKYNLPYFLYSGELPFHAIRPDGGQVKLPKDPWFLLGNYRMTLFAHTSGKIQILSGERAWGRLNFEDINTGGNNASLTIDKNNYDLLGLHSEAIKETTLRKFGIGYASYTYKPEDNIILSRTIHIKPSESLYDGISAYLMVIKVKNTGMEKHKVTYRENYTAQYEMNQLQRLPEKDKPLIYRTTVRKESKNLVIADFSGESNDLFLFGRKEEVALYDGYPPSFYISIPESDNEAQCQVIEGTNDQGNATIGISADFELPAGSEKTIIAVVGFTFDKIKIPEYTLKLTKNIKEYTTETGIYEDNWKKVLPLFPDEKDTVLQREMIWNAYCLEAMATYKVYYNEVMIPQGTTYDYDWGILASSRDHLQHGLPTCYYNPELAKSILRFTMKRMRPTGEIMLMEEGYGHNTHSNYFTSDQQLYFFYLLGEYLKVTSDYNFLFEKVKYYPKASTIEGTVYDHFEKCFTFLRDDIGKGSHGLIRLLNSDWNDMVYSLLRLPYNRTFHEAESHMNAAMALILLDEIWKPFDFFVISNDIQEENLRIAKLSASIERFRDDLLNAYLKDWGERSYPRRLYINDTLVFGENQMFLEPMGFTLQIREISREKKQELYQNIKEALLDNEVLGARQQEKPKDYDILPGGSRENGGFWWSLNGPLIIGVNSFDQEEAWRLLRKMTFDNFSKNFPDYWSGYWSASDNIDSSLLPTEGLPDQAYIWSEMPVYCAHAHAWPLYCYYKLKKNNSRGISVNI